MKTTISKLLNSDKALSGLLEQKLPLGISIQIVKVVSELEPVYKQANEARLEILKRHGVEVLKDGAPTGEYKIKPEALEQFQADMNSAFDSEIELAVPSIDPARMPEASISPRETIVLDWLWKKET